MVSACVKWKSDWELTVLVSTKILFFTGGESWNSLSIGYCEEGQHTLRTLASFSYMSLTTSSAERLVMMTSQVDISSKFLAIEITSLPSSFSSLCDFSMVRFQTLRGGPGGEARFRGIRSVWFVILLAHLSQISSHVITWRMISYKT